MHARKSADETLPPGKKQKVSVTRSRPITVRQQPQWTSEQQEEFARDLCRLFISCDISWNTANNIEFEKFIKKYIPQANVPDRRVLAGRVLNAELARVESATKLEVNGKLASGQGDTWKTISKVSCQAAMMAVEGKTHLIATHDISGEKKTADNLLALTERDIDQTEAETGVEFIAWCTDAGGDCNKMRKMLAARRPHILTPPCFAHQLNLLVKDYYKLDAEFMKTSNKAFEVVKWFNNHSQALGLFKGEQRRPREGAASLVPLALLLPAITRWTYHFQSFARLLRVQKPLRTCVIEHRDDLVVCAGNRAAMRTKAFEVIGLVEDHSGFWQDLARTTRHLEPLAIGTNVLQSNHARLDTVLLTLANLYRIFGDPDVELSVSLHMRKCIDARWMAVEPEPYILAVFFNPYIRSKIFKPENTALTPLALYNMAESMFRRLFRKEPDLEFMDAFYDYHAGEREFDPQYMQLEKTRLAYEREHKAIDLVRIWKSLDQRKLEGRNMLVKLAIRLLSVIANSAGSERLFSCLGIIISKIRNRLELGKANKMAKIKANMKDEQERNGLAPRRRLKRKFHLCDDSEHYGPSASGGTSLDSSAPTQPCPPGSSSSPGDATSSPSATADEDFDIVEGVPLSRILDGIADDDSSLDGERDADERMPGSPLATSSRGGHNAAPAPTSQSAIHGRECFSLKNLFRYDLDNEQRATTLEFYWKGGIRSLEEELALYDLLAEEQEQQGDELRPSDGTSP